MSLPAARAVRPRPRRRLRVPPTRPSRARCRRQPARARRGRTRPTPCARRRRSACRAVWHPRSMEQRRLTSFSHGAGCGCKLGPADLETVLGTLSLPELGADVLVGAVAGCDSAVVLLPDGQALVPTLDFFPPIVDDPYDWGRIAATNALSDVYAMG